MPAGKFDKLVRLRPKEFEVGGVFVTHGGVIGDVTIRFVLIPDREPKARTNPIVGTATIDNAPSDPKSGISETRFTAEANHSSLDPQPGTVVRGIGIAVAVKKPDPPDSSSNDHPDPPGFETFTWCVNLHVT